MASTSSVTTSTPASTATLGSTSASAGQSAKQPGVDYMKLIVAQMRTMNPMDPASGGDSLPTMMQAESLNQLAKLNQAITDLQTMSLSSYGATLIGRTVTGVDEGGKTVSGKVTGMKMSAGGPMLQLDGGKSMRLMDLSEVGNAATNS